MPSTTFRLATQADNAALLRLLRDNPMPGSISLTFEREPDYFVAAGLDGSLSQTVVSIDEETGECQAMGARSVRPVYLNGEVQDIGYLGHLRVDLRRGWGLSLARQFAKSFAKFHELHEDGRVPFYLASIISDNLPARRLLTAKMRGMPSAREYARMFTYAISPRRLRRELSLPSGLRLERGTPEHTSEIAACLQRNGARRQFAPHWPVRDLFSPARTPNLHPEDFLVAIQGSRVVGCLAVWDQTPFKQTIVRGYTGNMARWRPLINRLAQWIDVPCLPEINAPFPYCYASHLAIDQDNPRIFSTLLRAACNETVGRGFNYFMIGLSEANPLRPVLTRSYLHITYASQLYLVAWEDGLDAIERVDGRVPGLEIAVL
jgi:hypothetical protein